MAQTQTLQRRIRSVKNAGQITKALEVVAASRMRRIQDSVARVRRYAQVADSIMRKIAPSQEAQQHPYFKAGSGKTKLYIIFSSDRGQAGAYNSNVFSQAHKAFAQDKASGFSPAVIIFGRKGTHHFARLADIEILGAYEDIADTPDVNVFAPVLDAIESGFNSRQLSSVRIIYTEFKSSLVQTVRLSPLLPISLEASDQPETTTVYEFEPGIEAVLQEALKIYFEARFMAARVESAASEHAMRMVAMGNANRNAKDIVTDLILELNSVRQAAITQEIAEITGGAEAIAD
jgi:F-type H+-transporting ATPase subunit gamma